jgi:hypothetical protein
LAKLDADMDSYFAKKDEVVVEAVAEAVTEEAAVVEAAAVPETTTE